MLEPHWLRLKERNAQGASRWWCSQKLPVKSDSLWILGGLHAFRPNPPREPLVHFFKTNFFKTNPFLSVMQMIRRGANRCDFREGAGVGMKEQAEMRVREALGG